MHYYNVIDRNKFAIKIEHCPDITNLSDTFINQDQAAELMGRDVADGHGHYMPDQITFKHEVRRVLKDWINLIQPGKASTRRTTSEILEMQETLETWDMNDQLRKIGDEYVVSGKTIYNKELHNKKERKRADKLLKRDFKNLIRCCSCAISRRHKVEVNFRVNDYGLRCEAYNNLIFTKKICSWRDINEYTKDAYLLDNMDIPWIKQIWDDPILMKTTFN